jgi:hypothetical protein
VTGRRRPAGRGPAPSTVGRGRPLVLAEAPATAGWEGGGLSVQHGDALELCARWPAPAVIVSDGAYGVLGFDGDTAGAAGVPAWYAPHAEAWARAATPRTTLWFWNSEVGWAAAHPVLERHGWRYVGCNVWNKGRAHVAGNVNTATIRRFPVVTEVCVQYVREPTAGGLPLKAWLLSEWRRTGLPLREANAACGVKDAATRKYLDQSHLWYFPPPEVMARLAAYANARGRPEGRPYFALDGRAPVSAEAWRAMRATFRCPFGVTNVWDRGPVKAPERVRVPGGRAVHLNQKPLDLMARIVEAASEPGDVVWEPFGGLFTASLAAQRLGRRAFGAERDATYFQLGLARVRAEMRLEGAPAPAPGPAGAPVPGARPRRGRSSAA